MGTPLNKIPDNVRRRMVIDTVSSAAQILPAPELSKFERDTERKMHRMFEAWLMLNEITYIHARMDRKSTIREGWPDFSVFKFGQACFVEFKVACNEPTEAQNKVMLELGNAGFASVIARTIEGAISWTKNELGMT